MTVRGESFSVPESAFPGTGMTNTSKLYLLLVDVDMWLSDSHTVPGVRSPLPDG